MDISKVAIFLAIFVFINQSRINRDRVMLNALIMLGFSVMLTSVSSQNALLQLATFLQIACSAAVAGIVFKPAKPEERGNPMLFYIFCSFLLLNVFHNVSDAVTKYTLIQRNSINYLNSWGLASSFLFTFMYCTRQKINIYASKGFSQFVIGASVLLFLILMGILLGVISGNTAKVQDDVGGIGLNNMSTNETALLSLCLVVFLLSFLNDPVRKKGPTTIYIICIAIDIVVIVLSRSRVGLLSLAIIVLLFFLDRLRRNTVSIIPIMLGGIVVGWPLAQKLMSVIESRSANDTGVDTDFSTYSDTLGFTLSGRTLIWEAYTEQFLKMVERDGVLLFTGAGFKSLVDMYNRSFLALIGFRLERATFFPLHSDILLIFVTCGVIGIVLWFFMVRRVVIDLVKKPNFIVASFTLMLIFFTLFDMLNYSFFSTLMIGVGISQKNLT